MEASGKPGFASAYILIVSYFLIALPFLACFQTNALHLSRKDYILGYALRAFILTASINLTESRQ